MPGHLGNADAQFVKPSASLYTMLSVAQSAKCSYVANVGCSLPFYPHTSQFVVLVLVYISIKTHSFLPLRHLMPVASSTFSCYIGRGIKQY